MSESKSSAIKTLADGLVVVVAAGLVVSVIYDWGFVRALGLDFSYLPTTTADHFRSGILWFPPLLGVVLLNTAVEFQFQRIERGLTEKEIVESSSNPESMRKFREGPFKLVAWTAPVYVVIYILIGDLLSSFLPWAISIVWMGFAEWTYSAPLIRIRRNRDLQIFFTFLPIIGILSFFSGYNAAIDSATRKPIEVVIERSEQLPAISGNVLRTLDKGLLILSTNSFIQFIPWNQVKSVMNKKTYKPYRGLLCEWFNVCPQVVNRQ